MTNPNVGLLFAALLLTITEIATAGPCEAYFPFDGNLADVSGNNYHGLPVAKEGEPDAPQFADGKIGQALRITGGNAMRAFIDLHQEFCPQVTVTAWFRLESVDAKGNQYIFSTGAGGGPGIRAQNGGTVAMNGTGNGIYQPNAIRDKNTWFFVAGVYDLAAGQYRLHWRNRVVEGKFGSSRRPPEDSFWVGTYNDSMSATAQDLYIDDLRIHGSALSAGQLASLASDFSGRSGQSNAAGNTSGGSRAAAPAGNSSGGSGPAATGSGAGLTAGGIENTTQIPRPNIDGGTPAWITNDIRPGAEIRIDQLGTYIANNLAIGETEKNLAGYAEGQHAAPPGRTLSLRADLISRERGAIAHFAPEAVTIAPGGTYPASRWFRDTKAFNSALMAPLKPAEFVIFRIGQKTIVGIGPKIFPPACQDAPYAVLLTLDSDGNQFFGDPGTGKSMMALCLEGMR